MVGGASRPRRLPGKGGLELDGHPEAWLVWIDGAMGHRTGIFLAKLSGGIMTIRGLCAVMAAAAAVGWACEARAQAMPGMSSSSPSSSAARSLANRTGGARQGSMFGTGASGAVTTPTAAASEWMIQRSHQPGSFVGTDSTDKTGFVGAQQALDARARAVATGIGLGIRLNNRVNQILQARRANEMYHPQVVVAFDVPSRDSAEVSSLLARQLAMTPAIRATSPIEVSVAGTTATIRGEVASERDRALIEQMALFEPGISSVRNLLTLQAPTLLPPPLPAGPNPPK